MRKNQGKRYWAGKPERSFNWTFALPPSGPGGERFAARHGPEPWGRNLSIFHFYRVGKRPQRTSESVPDSHVFLSYWPRWSTWQTSFPLFAGQQESPASSLRGLR